MVRSDSRYLLKLFFAEINDKNLVSRVSGSNIPLSLLRRGICGGFCLPFAYAYVIFFGLPYIKNIIFMIFCWFVWFTT